MDFIRVLFSILLPPLGVFLQVGIGPQFWLNILLTLLGYIPGVVHPFVSDPSKVITIPKWRCVDWNEANPPDPYKVYL